MSPTPLELCEDFLVHLPPRLTLDPVVAEGYVCVPRGPAGTAVQRIRLADVGQVHAAVKDVRAIASAAEQPQATWWVGELATPDDVIDLLLAEGLEPHPEEPLLASLVLDHAPAGSPPPIDVVRVVEFEDFHAAQVIDLVTTGMPVEERERMLEGTRARWETIQSEGLIQTYLVLARGEPVAYARAARGNAGVALLGGGTLEAERGKGYYTALVHARWHDAAERGTPLLCTQAGKMSRPILERLGFVEVGEIRLLVDRL